VGSNPTPSASDVANDVKAEWLQKNVDVQAKIETVHAKAADRDLDSFVISDHGRHHRYDGFARFDNPLFSARCTRNAFIHA
jgi:hypothetical protein